jgi:hypothetical protein
LHGFNGGGAASGDRCGHCDHNRRQEYGNCQSKWIEGGDAVELAAEQASKGYDGG